MIYIVYIITSFSISTRRIKMITESIEHFTDKDLVNLLKLTEFQRYDYLLSVLPDRFRKCNDIDDDNEFYIIINDMIEFFK